MQLISDRAKARRRTRVISLALLVCATGVIAAPPALGASPPGKAAVSNFRAFTLPGHSTKTFTVSYPVALKYGDAKYSCTAKASGLGKRNVKILSRGSALGGSVCRVKVRNTAQLPSIDTTATVLVTATTVAPGKAASKRFTSPGHTTKTFDVAYPFALEFDNASYSCTASVSGLGKRNVKVLSAGSALGGTVCRVKVRNTAKLPSIDTTATVLVTATTLH
jgi:hypothetical protein